MRTTARLLANVKSGSKFLEANTPTGLTGLSTHPAPRPALIYTYRETLKKLALLPSTSVYRQSTEALTKYRLAIVEATKPAGFEAWLSRVHSQIEKNPDSYANLKNEDGTLSQMKLYQEKRIAWDGTTKRNAEGINSESEAAEKVKIVEEEVQRVDRAAEVGELKLLEDLEAEPPLDRDQISEIEAKIEAGLIEEIVEVAEGELELVDEMLEAKVWEPLEEKAPPGQWQYFERGTTV